MQPLLKAFARSHLGDKAETLTTQLQHEFPKAKLYESDPALQDWVEQVLAFVEAPQPCFNLCGAIPRRSAA
ncbi:MAG: hypothetical protein IGS48_13465 [Oscillatoriales cyanobacterium C42_A2020_001]|nr:hypothetical protein [Leptolyngbyaceae cyanobacterium C42_A2020_001]